jgi:hypothetical protein
VSLTPVPVTRQQLVRTGHSKSALDEAVRAGRRVVPFRGVHVDARHSDGLLARLRAALSTQGPASLVAMQSAAVLLALPWVPEQWAAGDVHLVVPPADAHRHRRGLRLHRRSVPDDEVTAIHGLRCMDATRTLIELARNPALGPTRVVQLLDGGLRAGATTAEALTSCLSRMPGERGVARARLLLGRSRTGVDSPQETVVRLILEDAGIVDLEVGIEIRDGDGLLRARGDLGSSRWLVWGEYDGFRPHTERGTFRSDRVGDRWLQRRGWHVMRFVDEDVRRPSRLCREWLQAIADAPARIAALPAGRSP